LTRGYSAWLAREGITVNAIAPALIATDMLNANPRARPDLIPIGRFGTVDEVASVTVSCRASEGNDGRRVAAGRRGPTSDEDTTEVGPAIQRRSKPAFLGRNARETRAVCSGFGSAPSRRK
jgi:hypothetical protein